MYKFLTDGEFRENALKSAGHAVHAGSRLGKAFLNSAALYFSREFPRNLKKHPFNPMLALGETLFAPMIKFMTEAVEQIAAHYIPQYQCMNGTAKLYTICRVLGDFIMPPAILFTFLKSGINGLRLLKRGAEASKIARAERRFQEANELREVLATSRGAADSRVARITLDQRARVNRVLRTEKERPSSLLTPTPEAHPPKPAAPAPLLKPIEEHSADELIEVARSEQADALRVAPKREVLTAEEEAQRLVVESRVEVLIQEAKVSPAIMLSHAQDPEYAALFKAEKQYPEQARDISIVISDMEKKNPQMKKSEIREEIEKFLNTCELRK